MHAKAIAKNKGEIHPYLHPKAAIARGNSSARCSGPPVRFISEAFRIVDLLIRGAFAGESDQFRFRILKPFIIKSTVTAISLTLLKFNNEALINNGVRLIHPVEIIAVSA
ncbi:MAG TPA: hypothetical protein VE954_03785, partial [Oligoflexus sp.]|uniref:hypothetical protein n=1 Tax=Oligoflexus sp. TaxID=1971216 RepID=UPI002D391EE1